MTHEQLVSLFKLVYPTGCVFAVPGKRQAYDVQYAHGGKQYRYNATSRIALARRLGLDASEYERDYSNSTHDDTVPEFIAGLPASDWGY